VVYRLVRQLFVVIKTVEGTYVARNVYLGHRCWYDLRNLRDGRHFHARADHDDEIHSIAVVLLKSLEELRW
jgi:hypothetical protein